MRREGEGETEWERGRETEKGGGICVINVKRRRCQGVAWKTEGVAWRMEEGVVAAGVRALKNNKWHLCTRTPGGR